MVEIHYEVAESYEILKFANSVSADQCILPSDALFKKVTEVSRVFSYCDRKELLKVFDREEGIFIFTVNFK